MGIRSELALCGDYESHSYRMANWLVLDGLEFWNLVRPKMEKQVHGGNHLRPSNTIVTTCRLPSEGIFQRTRERHMVAFENALEADLCDHLFHLHHPA